MESERGEPKQKRVRIIRSKFYLFHFLFFHIYIIISSAVEDDHADRLAALEGRMQELDKVTAVATCTSD